MYASCPLQSSIKTIVDSDVTDNFYSSGTPNKSTIKKSPKIQVKLPNSNQLQGMGDLHGMLLPHQATKYHIITKFQTNLVLMGKLEDQKYQTVFYNKNIEKNIPTKHNNNNKQTTTSSRTIKQDNQSVQNAIIICTTSQHSAAT